MTTYQAQDPNFEQRVRGSFARQTFMTMIGAEITDLRPGLCEIQLPHREDLCQQHGFFHGGIIGALADNAAGYACYSLMPQDASILTVEYKINLLAPGDGNLLIARSKVLRPGRTLVVAQSEVFVVKAGSEKFCAVALVTMMTLEGRSDHARQRSE